VLGDHIPDKDDLFRAIHFPLAFDKKKNVARNRCWNFPNDPESNSRETSLIWTRYAPTLNYVHAYGCRASAIRNNKPGRKTPDVYCGVFGVGAGSLRDIATNAEIQGISAVELYHWIETEEIAHASLRVTFDETRWIDAGMTEFVARIEEVMTGPARFAHKDNADANKTATEATIPEAASGPYVDRRTRTERIFCLVRFYVLRLKWNFRIWQARRATKPVQEIA